MIARPSPRRTIVAAMLLAALLATLLVLAPASRGDGVTTFTVTSLEDEAGVETCEPTAECTLREAINSIAEEEEEGAEFRIVFAVEGTIELTEQLRLYNEEEDVSVQMEGPGATKLIIDGAGNGRVLNARNVSLEMSGVTLTGGEESAIVDGGGGLLVVDASAKLTGVRVNGNVIGGDAEGGGIAVENGATLELVDSVVADNVSESEMGGGVFVESGSSASFYGSTIEGNEAAEDAGGGIAAELGGIFVEGSTIKGNRSAEGGGGLWIGSGEPGVEILDSVIEGNHSDTYGGGLKSEGNLVLNRSTVAGNTAGGNGGGLYVEEETTVRLSTVSGNSALGSGLGGGGLASVGPLEVATSTIAENEGGGVAVEGAAASIRNSTVVGNTAPSGGNAAGAYGTDVAIDSSILFDNLRDGQPSDCGGTVESEGFNLLGSTAECGWTSASGDRVGEDPELAPLGDHGGPTATMPPESRLSPAINHGENPEATDQRGLTRPVPAGDPNTDIGAVEVQAPSLEAGPSISPSTELDVGETLTCDPGTWDVDTIADPVYSYSWVLDPGGLDEQVGTGSALQLTAAMAGEDLLCAVSVDNGATTASAESAAVVLEPAQLTLVPEEIDFGSRRLGAGPSAGTTVQLSASGGVPVEVTAIESTDPVAFPVEASACVGKTLSRSSCEFEVAFDPDEASALKATIEVQTSGPGGSVAVQGLGIQPQFQAVPSALAMATTEVGDESATQQVSISNAGDGELEIDEVLLEGANSGDFRIVSQDCAGASLRGPDTCSVALAFAPTAAGARAAELVLSGPEPATVPLTGTAIAPGLAASPPSLAFGSREVGAGPTAPSTLVLSNPGSAPTRIDSIAIAGPDAADFAFAANGCVGGVLAPGAECSLSLTFDPAAAGARNAQVLVGGELSATVPLSGTGTEPPPAPSLRFQRGKGPLAVSANGIVRPRLSCSAAGGSCQGTVRLRRAPGAGAGLPATLASKRFQLGAGTSRTIALRLNGAARRALAERGRLPVVLTAGSVRADVALR